MCHMVLSWPRRMGVTCICSDRVASWSRAQQLHAAAQATAQIQDEKAQTKQLLSSCQEEVAATSAQAAELQQKCQELEGRVQELDTALGECRGSLAHKEEYHLRAVMIS
jgi:septal ring factor EnvC (AmiA/AmiB activator)